MITPIETLRTQLSTMDELAIAYANALVVYWQTNGVKREEALRAMLDVYRKLSTMAETIAQTI